MDKSEFFSAKKMIKLEVAIVTTFIKELFDNYKIDYSYREYYEKSERTTRIKVVEKVVQRYILNHQDIFGTVSSFNVSKRFKSYFKVIQKEVIENSKNPMHQVCNISLGTLRIILSIKNRKITDYKKVDIVYPKGTRWKLFIKELYPYEGKEHLKLFKLTIFLNGAAELVNDNFRFTGSINAMSQRAFSGTPIEGHLHTNYHILELTGKDGRGIPLKIFLIVDFTFSSTRLCFGAFNLIIPNETVLLYNGILKQLNSVHDPFSSYDSFDRVELTKDTIDSDIKLLLDTGFFGAISIKDTKLSAAH